MSKDQDAALMADIAARCVASEGPEIDVKSLAAELGARHYHRHQDEIEEKIIDHLRNQGRWTK